MRQDTPYTTGVGSALRRGAGFVRAMACSAALTGAVAPALAADGNAEPTNSLRVGLYSVGYKVSATDLSGPFTPSGINIDVERVNTVYLAYVRRLNASLDLELAAGIPPTTHTIGKGPAYLGSVPFNGQEVVTAKWFSPSLLLEYKFLEEGSALRPFVGLGVNYTHFYDRKSTAAGDAANGGPTTIKMSDSWGPVGTLGVVYHLTREIVATASYSRAQVNSTYESNTAGVVRRSEVHFNPRIVVLAVGYSF